jgi:dihydroflavonol-4-reductase
MDMSELFGILQEVSGIPAPRQHLPLSVLYALAVVNEAWHFVSRKPVLISLAGVRLMAQSRGRHRCDSTKVQLELGVHFRPVRETLREAVDWYRQNGWDHQADREPKQLRPTGESI